jgi:hypothetical protein
VEHCVISPVDKITITYINEKGTIIKRDIWRNGEILDMPDPINVAWRGLLYTIQYCTQYIENGTVKDKSEKFKKVTAAFEWWIKENVIQGMA